MAKKQSSRRRARRGRLSVLTSGGREPRLEALSVLLDLAPGRNAHALARALTQRLRLAGWQIDPVTDDGVEWEIVPPTRNVGGAGIVDARRLLETPLPAAAPARKLRDARRAAVATDTTGIETLVHLLPDVPRTRVEERVAELLGVSDRALPSVLQDYGDELAFQVAMQPALLETLRKSTRGGKAAAGGRRATRRMLATAPVSASLRKRLTAR